MPMTATPSGVVCLVEGVTEEIHHQSHPLTLFSGENRDPFIGLAMAASLTSLL